MGKKVSEQRISNNHHTQLKAKYTTYYRINIEKLFQCCFYIDITLSACMDITYMVGGQVVKALG